MRHYSRSLGLLVATSIAAYTGAAYAQQAETGVTQPEEQAGSLEDIVVTARRTNERLIDVPVSVTALSAAMIERAHITDLTQVAQMTPSLVVAAAGSGTGGSISIRGIGTSYLDPGVEQSVGLIVDSVPIGRGHFLSAAQFDLQQIEVLKGPQALFFGKNSPAGVVSISSADPTPDLSGMVRAGYEFEAKERFAEAFVAGPISETLGFRVAAKYSKLDGWFKNVVPAGPSLSFPGFNTPGALYDEGPGQRQLIGRVTLKWQPTSDLTANLKFTANQAKGNNLDSPEAFCVAGSPGAATGKLSTVALGTGALIEDPNSDCRLDHRTSRGQLPLEFLANWPLAAKYEGRSWFEVRTYIGTLNVNYQMGPLTLSSITGYSNVYAYNYSNASQDSYSTVTSTPGEKGHSITEEVRLQSAYDGPINFTIGGFFEKAHRFNSYQPMLGFIGFDASNGGSVYSFKDHYVSDGRTYSAFGQLRWKLADTVELAGGVRYTHESKKTTGVQDYVNGLGLAFGLAPSGSRIDVRNTFSNWSPEVTLRYKPSDNMMAYVAYKTGYKSGGISTPATIAVSYVADPDLLQFAPEKSKGFEAGIKAELLNRRVRLDLTIYRYTFSNLQLSSFDANQSAYFIKNAGEARTTGAEASAVWQVTPDLSLTANAAYNRAKFVDFQNAQCYALLTLPGAGCSAAGTYDRTGQPLPRAPKGTFSAGFNYERPIGNGLKIGMAGDAVHTSSYMTSESGDPNADQEAFWRVNASVKVAAEDDRWELALLGRNLTNEYITVVSNDKVFTPPGQIQVFSVRPREVVLQGTFRF